MVIFFGNKPSDAWSNFDEALLFHIVLVLLWKAWIQLFSRVPYMGQQTGLFNISQATDRESKQSSKQLYSAKKMTLCRIHLVVKGLGKLKNILNWADSHDEETLLSHLLKCYKKTKKCKLETN